MSPALYVATELPLGTAFLTSTVIQSIGLPTLPKNSPID